VLEFLLLDRQFPRSVLHALTVGEDALARLEPAAEWDDRSGRAAEARRLIGRVRTDLEFLPPEALGQGLPERLRSIQRGVSDVSESVGLRYFGSSALVGWNREEADWIDTAP
jgi:uncharacterized alpha-E superfamily protein